MTFQWAPGVKRIEIKQAFNHLNAIPTKWSNTLKHVWVCLTILRGWRLKGEDFITAYNNYLSQRACSTINSCGLYFLCISKVWSMLHHKSVGRVQGKQCISQFTYTFLAFLLLFYVKKFASIIFICFLFVLFL